MRFAKKRKNCRIKAFPTSLRPDCQQSSPLPNIKMISVAHQLAVARLNRRNTVKSSFCTIQVTTWIRDGFLENGHPSAAFSIPNWHGCGCLGDRSEPTSSTGIAAQPTATLSVAAVATERESSRSDHFSIADVLISIPMPERLTAGTIPPVPNDISSSTRSS